MRLVVNIDVPELAPAIAFYQAAVGARLARFLEDDTAELIYGDNTLYLQRNAADSDAAHGAGIHRSYLRHWTPVHIDFVVDNLVEAVERAIAAGAKRETDCMAWLGSKWVSFSDPFGHGFCLIEFNGSTYEDPRKGAA
jgi:uncharacterized glyoxalase superfamily protein PhnB